MVFYSRGRGRGATRGRGRGVGEVAFEPQRPHPPSEGRDAREPPESLRITVGNDQFREHRDESPSIRHEPPTRDYSYDHRQQEEHMYRREADAYGHGGHGDRASYEREREYDRRDMREPPRRPEERDYGDRRGFGGESYKPSYEQQPPSAYQSQPPARPSQPLFPAASRSPPPQIPTQPPAGSRPLKSILKKKPDPVPEAPKQSKPSGLPGIASYMDDIEDEDKFLYGDDGRDRRQSGHNARPGGPYQPPVEDMRSAAQSWQPSAPVSSTHQRYPDQQQQQYQGNTGFQNQPAQQGYQSQPAQQPQQSEGDLWSMLAKSVQTVQQQQQQFPPQNQFAPQQDNFQQQQFSAQQAAPAPVQPPAQEAQAQGHDPTIENILKSIGFDFEMSKRMQEKAKQGTEPPKPALKPSDSQFGINHTASFIGSEMSHEAMRSQLAPGLEQRSSVERAPDRPSERIPERIPERREPTRPSQDMFAFDDRSRPISSRDRMNSPKKGKSPERLQRGCSPISNEGSPPPPMFNLPPITIKRRTNIERNISPNWDKNRSLSRSPTRDTSADRNKHRSKSPAWNRSIAGYGRRSRSPDRRRSPSPRTRSPAERAISPVIKRTFNLDALSPLFRRKVSPRRSLSPGRKRSRSPRRRSPGRRSRSPSRRSRSPGRRSRSPGRRKRSRSRSPGRRSRSPGRRHRSSPSRRSPGRRSPGRRRSRSRSPRRRGRSPSPHGRKRSISPRGRKRGFGAMSSRSRSRERKLRRSSSRDKYDRRSRSRSRGRGGSRSPRPRRQSLSSLSSDSDPDGPANKKYFSSPLRLGRNRPPSGNFQQGPPSGPPPGAFPGPPPGVPPAGFGGPPPGFPMQGMPPPPGQPPFGMPPPMMSQPPPSIPPPGFPYGAPNPVMYSVAAPVMVQPPIQSQATYDPEMAPPGTMEMPLNIPARSNSNQPDASSEKHEKESVASDRSDHSGRKERSRRRSSERTSSSNRTVLPPRVKSKDDASEGKSSFERVVIISKQKKDSKDSKKSDVDKEKERAKLVKEKEIMVNKIKVLEVEFNSLKAQEFDLKKKSSKDGKVDPILNENKKLLYEIKKEINKIVRQKEDLENKHEFLKDSSREVKVTPKKPASEKSEKKKEEFKVEKGKMMKHQFIDKGDHWCKACMTIHSNIQDFIHHLGSYRHKQSLPTDRRPWMDGFQANDGMILNKQGQRISLPGVEFMMPVSAYYCELCKVFLGDTSGAVDHFKCESHYLNYKKYLSQNQFYEKKWKEERDKAVKQLKGDKIKAEIKKKTEEQAARKRTNSEKDAKIRENEKKWDQNVDDLDIDVESSGKPGSSKSQIKLSLKNQKSDESEKSKDSDKSADTKEQGKGDENSETDKEKDKNKINFNISLAGKAIVGKTGPGAAKKNPLLPPWQPVGKKGAEVVKKPGETAASLDTFLTTGSGDGKIPVVAEKKKVSAKDVLASFSDRSKRKKEAAKHQLSAEEERIAAEEAAERAKQEFLEQVEKRMLGIEAENEKPLAEIIPPPPVTQNVPLPDQIPSATVTAENVHAVFNSDISPVKVTNVKIEEDGDSQSEVKSEILEIVEEVTDAPGTVKQQVFEIDLDDIQLPRSDSESPPLETVKLEVPKEPEVKDTKEENTEIDSDAVKTENVVTESIKEEIESVKQEVDSVEQEVDSVVDEPKSEEKIVDIKQESDNAVSETAVNDETSVNGELSNSVNAAEIPIPKATEPMKIDPELGILDEQDSELNKSDELMNLEMLEADTNQFNTMFESSDANEGIATDDVLGALESINAKDGLDMFGMQTVDEVKFDDLGDEIKPTSDNQNETKTNDNADVDKAETNESKTESSLDNVSLIEENKSETEVVDTPKTDDGNVTTEAEEEPVEEEIKPSRGRGRKRGGRGRGRGKGSRGRGRGAKSTRSTRSAKVEEEDPETDPVADVLEPVSDAPEPVADVSEQVTETETDNKTNVTDNIETDTSNKDLELPSSVEIGQTTSSSPGKRHSPRKRKTSMKTELVAELDTDLGAISDASGISMEMGSDFEVVDDLEDMDVLDEVM